MSKWAPFRLTTLCVLLTWAFSARATDTEAQNLDRQFKSAVADYNAGHFAEAADKLQSLLPQVPNSFEVHELLGLTYASLSQDQKAIEQLRAAVQIKPDSAPAHTNLAASLSHAGKTALAGEQFRKALELEPADYTANHNLGEFYVQARRLREACRLLERAQQAKPDSYDNGYDLAMADFLTGRSEDAGKVIESLLKLKDTGELHNLLGQIDEKDGKFVEAAKDYDTAAHIDPSDDNLFAWGSELLLHRTYEPAVDVFKFATQRFPDSPRLQIGLGMALYARGLYEESVDALLKAVDLSPDDPRCYQFLARAYDSSPKQADEVIQRFRRYAELQPGNARAQYYYAMSRWKGKRLEQTDPDLKAVEALLKKSIAIEGTFPDAHVQLGNLYADQHQYQQSIPEYQRALELDPNLPDAHYRLGTDYVHAGQKDKAQQEFAVYQKLRAQHLAEDDKERAEVQQFVYAAKGIPASRP